MLNNFTSQLNERTSLHWATKQNHFNVVKFLLSVGADAKIESKDGRLPGELATNDSIRGLFNLSWFLFHFLNL